MEQRGQRSDVGLPLGSDWKGAQGSPWRLAGTLYLGHRSVTIHWAAQ